MWIKGTAMETRCGYVDYPQIHETKGLYWFLLWASDSHKGLSTQAKAKVADLSTQIPQGWTGLEKILDALDGFADRRVLLKARVDRGENIARPPE